MSRNVLSREQCPKPECGLTTRRGLPRKPKTPVLRDDLETEDERVYAAIIRDAERRLKGGAR